MSISKETKIYFDDLFQTNWAGTEIHYAGEEFNGANLEEWVNPVYMPSMGYHTDLCGTTMNTGVLHVACWSDTHLGSLELSDTVVDFIRANVDSKYYRVRRFQVADSGWNGKKAFILLSFSIEVLARYNTCITSIGGADGAEFNLNGTWSRHCTIFKG